jgi:REP-associated tyrosine transposase
MAHAYTRNFVHCVFSTKDRRATIPGDLQERLWAYLGGIAVNLGVRLMAVGGTTDHVHILISLPPRLALAEVIQKLKANSSRWLGEHGVRFGWQNGYGGFSVSPPALEKVSSYIRHQAEHHKKRNFEEEFITLRKMSEIVFDEREALR